MRIFKPRKPDWQLLGAAVMGIWMILVAVLFFAQFALEFDTAVDLLRRVFPVP